jgi:hypothetical protein
MSPWLSWSFEGARVAEERQGEELLVVGVEQIKLSKRIFLLLLLLGLRFKFGLFGRLKTALG